MRREEATKFLREKLDEHGLKHWHIRLSNDNRFVGMCDHKSLTIVLNIHHVDSHPESEIKNTVLHEIAHALTPNDRNHGPIWQAKAHEIGCDNMSPVCGMALRPDIIDAIRSGDMVEIEVEEVAVKQIISIPKEIDAIERKVNYRVTKLQDRCPVCSKVAVEKFSYEAKGKKFITLECMHLLVKDIPKQTPFETIVFDGDPNCKHEWLPRIIDGKEIPGTICKHCGAKRPYDFQIEGMRFLEKHYGRAAIFDEMGLGKTLQGLGYIKFHPEATPFLYVCKAGPKFQVGKEIIRILGHEYMPYMFQTGTDFIFPGFKAYIISYDLFRRMSKESLAKLGKIIKCVIIDECQHIKNPDSTRTQELRRFIRDNDIQHVIPLSGTHWKNRGSESFVALNLINATKFGNFERFKRDWVQYHWEGNKLKEGGLKKGFREYCSDIFIRRERHEVMKELPLVNRTKLNCEMPREAMEAYDDAVDKFVKIYNQFIIGGEEDSFGANSSVIGALNTMRQIIGIAKIPATIDYVTEFLDNVEDEKILIFVHHIAVGQEIYQQMKEYCDANDLKVVRLTSDMSAEERFEMQETFNNDKSCRVAVLSTLAAGEALNLQTCSNGVMHERQWNPMNEEQPEGRMIRIGQKSKTVNMVYVHAHGTCDVDLDGIVESKRINFHNSMNKGEMIKWDQNSIIKELANLTVLRWKERRKKSA